jgi:hypothetical protein
MRSEVEKRNPGRERRHELDDRARDQDLPAVRHAQDARRVVKREADPVVAHLGHLAGVQRHADPYRRGLWPGLRREPPLALDG